MVEQNHVSLSVTWLFMTLYFIRSVDHWHIFEDTMLDDTVMVKYSTNFDITMLNSASKQYTNLISSFDINLMLLLASSVQYFISWEMHTDDSFKDNNIIVLIKIRMLLTDF